MLAGHYASAFAGKAARDAGIVAAVAFAGSRVDRSTAGE